MQVLNVLHPVTCNVAVLFLFSSHFFLWDAFLSGDMNNASWKAFFHFHSLVNLHDDVGCRGAINVLAFLLIYVINLFLNADTAFRGCLINS